MDWLQLLGENLGALIDNPLAAQAVAGAVEGVVIGLIVGAIVWAVMQAPDTLGRGLLLAIIFALIVIIWEFARIGSVMGMSMGSIIDSFNENPAIGRMFLQAGIRALLAMLIGMVIGIGSQVPNHMIRGGIIGILLGVLVGALLRFGLSYFGVDLNVYLYRGLVALGTWAIMITFSGK